MDARYSAFLQNADDKFNNGKTLLAIHDCMVELGCTYDVETTKSGYMVSYSTPDKRKLANLVGRKTGIKIRIYADHISSYQEILEEIPDKMKKEIGKASICKRLANPDACNPKCRMGYSFALNGELVQKCRFSAFMPTVNAENEAAILNFLESECRAKK